MGPAILRLTCFAGTFVRGLVLIAGSFEWFTITIKRFNYQEFGSGLLNRLQACLYFP